MELIEKCFVIPHIRNILKFFCRNEQDALHAQFILRRRTLWTTPHSAAVVEEGVCAAFFHAQLHESLTSAVRINLGQKTNGSELNLPPTIKDGRPDFAVIFLVLSMEHQEHIK
ncbi:hypothetical protein MTO96_046361 [Rhipicephalus appendiculatus]